MNALNSPKYTVSTITTLELLGWTKCTMHPMLLAVRKCHICKFTTVIIPHSHSHISSQKRWPRFALFCVLLWFGTGRLFPWASYQIRKIAGCTCAGNAGNVFPATDFKGNRSLAIPACITARASRTCRDDCRDRLPTVAGKRSRHSRRKHNPQFCVSVKRPIS